MKIIQLVKSITVSVFIIGATVATFISILSIWDILEQEAVSKSVSTIGILAFGSFVIFIAAKLLEKDSEEISGVKKEKSVASNVEKTEVQEIR